MTLIELKKINKLVAKKTFMSKLIVWYYVDDEELNDLAELLSDCSGH